MQFHRQKEVGSLSSSCTKTKQRIKRFNILYFLQQLTVLKLTRVKCFTEFLRLKKNIGEKILAVDYRVCVCVCVRVCVCVCIKLSLIQGKFKIDINTQLSESDLNHNNEIPGHRRGSMVQLLGRRRKENL